MPNLLITIPSHDGRIDTKTSRSLLNLRHAGVNFEVFYLNFEESFLYRQLCVEEFVGTNDYTHWLSLDSDMGFHWQLIQKLIDAKKDVICALSFSRRPPRRLAYVGLTEDAIVENKIFRIRYAGLACALITRNAINTMCLEYPATAALSEASSFRIHKWFEPIFLDGVYLEPDYAFQHRYSKSGGEIWGIYPGQDIVHWVGACLD